MKTLLIQNIKRQLILFFAVAALAVVTLGFSTTAQAGDGGEFFVVLEGRGILSDGHSTVWLEEYMVGQNFGPTGRFADIDTDFARFSVFASKGAWKLPKPFRKTPYL